ncbi:hypothetical protein ACOSP7_020965 [Xanthoceras sorbifolium]
MTRTYELREFAFFLPNIKPRKGLSLYCTTAPSLSVEMNCAGTRALRPESMKSPSRSIYTELAREIWKNPPKESPFRSKDAGLYFHGGIFLFMDAPLVVLDALSFPGLLRILSVPPDFKTPVEEAESRRRDSKDQVQGTSGTPPRLGTALVFLGIKIFVTLQNFTFHRGSARHIIRIRSSDIPMKADFLAIERNSRYLSIHIRINKCGSKDRSIASHQQLEEEKRMMSRPGHLSASYSLFSAQRP